MGKLYTGTLEQLEQALVAHVRELRRGRPLAPLSVVVGSAPLRTRVGDLLVRELGGVANVSVLTVAAFARRTAQGTGRPAPPLLPAQARERLVRHLLAQAAGQGRLRRLGPVRERPHVPGAVAATLADLREALVPATALQPALAAAGCAAADDLAWLYEAYARRLESLGLGDEASQYQAAVVALQAAAVAAAPGATPPAAEHVSGAEAPAPHVLLYGLYDLNDAQQAFAESLLRAGADTFVPALPAPQGAQWPVVAAAGRAGCVPQPAPAPPLDTDGGRLAAWSVSGQTPAEHLALQGDGSLAVLSVSHERAEALQAAREVLRAVLAGARAWECAVVVPAEADKPRVAQALVAAGLPVACRLPDTSAAVRTLLRLLDCLAPVAGRPFSRRAVLDLLAAAELRLQPAEVRLRALWADEARRAGVVGGLAQWQERLARRRDGLQRRLARRAAAPGGEGAAGEQPGAPRDDEPPPHEARQLEAVTALLGAVEEVGRACDELPAQAGWSGWAQAFAALAGRLLAPAQAIACADATLRLQALAPIEEVVDLGQAAAALRESLIAARAPRGRVGRRGVAVLSPLECRGLRFHTVVFTGLAEGGFPSRGRPDPILGDAQRARLTEALQVRLPLAEQRAAEAAAQFALACQGARRRLVLLAPRADAATGRPRLPSRLLLRMAASVAGHAVGLDEFQSGAPLQTVWRRVGGTAQGDEATWIDAPERDQAVLLGLGAPQARTQYLAAALHDAEAARRRLGQWQAARNPEPGPWDGLLEAEAREALAARHPFAGELHPTSLERYITCPFAFLLHDVMGLEAPQEPDDELDMDPLEFGTLAHDILQRTYQAVIDEKLGLPAAKEALHEAWQQCCAAAERRGVTGAPLAWRARREALRQDLERTLEVDPVFARADGRPVQVEWRFGQACGRPVTLALPDGRSVSFAGRADRIDAIGDGRRVIDYKTGAGATEKARLKDDLSVQLPVYQLAVRQAWPQGAAVSAEYRLVTRRGGFQTLPLPQDEDDTVARLARLVGDAAALIDRGLFPRTRRDRCDYCDLRYGCGQSAWTRMRKRGHERLRPVVELQSRPSPEQDQGQQGEASQATRPAGRGEEAGHE